MKISIQIKFFVILLAFSLGPIFISRTLMGRASKEAIESMSQRTRQELLSIMSAELEHSAVNLLSILKKGGESITLAVHGVAREAEIVLSKPVPTQKAKIYFARDFADTERRPEDTETSSRYRRRTNSGMYSALPYSLDYPAFRLPMMQKPATVMDDIQRLSSMTRALQTYYNEMPQGPFWLNVGLENGVFMTYPGHGSIPPMYDHRDQNWYRYTIWMDQRSWSVTVDPATKNIVTTASYPVRAEDGTFLGAASLDAPTFAMMPEDELSERWQGRIKTYLVNREPSADDDGKGLPILAQHTYSTKGGRHHWSGGVEQEWLIFDDAVAYNILVKAVDTRSSGVIEVSYNGEPSLCAFASEKQKGYLFMLIAPRSVVEKLPNTVSNTLTSLFEEIRQISSIVSGVMLVVIAFIAWFGSRTIIRPLIAMVAVARRLADGDFSARITTRTNDERDSLIESLNDMGPKLQSLVHLNRDMELAEEVQRLLLPKSEPTLSGYDLSGGILYCDQTGGDYYDFLPAMNDDGEGLGVVIGDVSGHGIPSALVMAAARSQLHTLSTIAMAPSERINSINKVLSRDLFGTGRFLTLFYLRLEADSPEVQWVRAGHDPAIRYNPAKDSFGELNGEGLALGVMEEFDFHSYSTALIDGEFLVMATDGVWEARNAEGHMFGKERMLAIIRQNAQNDAETIRLAIMDGVLTFTDGNQEDDIAVVVVRKTSKVE